MCMDRSSPEEERSAETDPDEAVHSPLNEVIPYIHTEEVQPLVVFYLDRAAALAQRESREVLAEMFLELIATISNLILEAFRNTVLEGHTQEHPLLVIEQAVGTAVQGSLTDSFNEVLGAPHQSVRILCQGLVAEVTNRVNSVLAHSQVQNDRLVVPEETTYRPTKERMKDLVRHARQILRDFKNRVGQGFRGCFPTKSHCASTETLDEDSEREELEVDQKAPSSTQRLRSTAETPEVVEWSTEEKVQPSSQCKTLKQTLSCFPCTGSEQHGAESEEEQPRASPPTVTLSPMCGSRDFMKTSSPASVSNSLTPGSPSGRLIILPRVSSPSIQEATEEVREILLTEAVLLSGEEERSLSDESLRAASSIVSSITEELRHMEAETQSSVHGIYKTRSPSLKGVGNKIKGFFTYCYAKSALRGVLRHLCTCTDVRPGVSPEVVMEKVSPLLKELVPEVEDAYKSLPPSITQGSFKLSETLTDNITTAMALAKDQEKFRAGVRPQVLTFMDQIWHWVQEQNQLPDQIDPVQRTLGQIRRLIYRMWNPCQTTSRPQLSYEEQARLPPQPQPQLYGPILPPQPGPRPGMWSRDDCNKLVYEVVSKIFEAEFHPLSVRLSQDLLAQLEDQVPEWIVLVHPNRYKEVAKAVYKDLCNGEKKIHVKHAALAQRGFSSTVLEAIHRNMVVPLKRKCTLSTFLRSLCSVFCRH